MRVACYLSPDFQMLDLAGPADAFAAVRSPKGVRAYEVVPVSQHGGVVRANNGVVVQTASLRDVRCDTLLISGGPVDPPPERKRLRILEASAAKSRRVASVCTGAFLLASIGLLDGKRATTHWLFAGILQRRHPAIRVEPDRIYCREDDVWTSAGITAGIDLALAMIEQDQGFDIASRVARQLVVYHRRHGGQSQFANSTDIAIENPRIAAALLFARENIATKLTIGHLANAASLSERHFTRLFRAETGTTPAKSIERMRADIARGLVESSTKPLEQIAVSLGFGDGENMRLAFLRSYGQPPQALRRSSRL